MGKKVVALQLFIKIQTIQELIFVAVSSEDTTVNPAHQCDTTRLPCGPLPVADLRRPSGV